jgi:hypothetical protein
MFELLDESPNRRHWMLLIPVNLSRYTAELLLAVDEDLNGFNEYDSVAKKFAV